MPHLRWVLSDTQRPALVTTEDQKTGYGDGDGDYDDGDDDDGNDGDDSDDK